MNASKQEVLPAIERSLDKRYQKMLNELLDFHGIAKNFIDCSGTNVVIPHSQRVRILEALGVNPSDEISIAAAHQYFTRDRYKELVSPANVISDCDGQALRIFLSEQQLYSTWQWKIRAANKIGEHPEIIFSGEFRGVDLHELRRLCISADDESKISERQLPLPTLPMGYYTLEIEGITGTAQSRLIVAPSRCYAPSWEQNNRKLGGLSVQLYSLRSNRNWGVGDFGDLQQLLSEVKTRGIDFVVLSPLHMLNASEPEHCSPYSPIDRCRLNPLYIDPQLETDFRDCEEIQKHCNSSAFQRQLERLRGPEFVNYTEVTAIKYKVLAQMFSHFKKQHLKKSTARAQEFQLFIKQQGEALDRFVHYQAQTSTGFTHAKDPLYHCYLQWLSEMQLEACQQRADKLGMEIGLIRDLAIGSQRHSAEVNLNPNLFAQNASIGAPPDPLAPQGQNWGLPPMKPLVLQQSGYQHFIELLQANMAHCKALRIDHVMGLMRLWWCAENKYLPNICETQDDPKLEAKPSKTSVQNLHGEGAYVAYPVDELFAILRLESQRNHCLVIGEDLGIVPPEIRTRMASSGLFSNALFYFEKYDPIRFKVPQHFIPKALTMIANHDVPTLAAWWNKSDLATRSQIGLINSDEEFQRAVRERESDLIQIMHWLNDAGLLPDRWRDFNIHKAFDYDLCRALLQANARSASQLVSLQLEDLCLTESPVNIPGTCTEYPNWRRKVPQNLDTIFNCPETDALLSAFVQARTS